MKKTNPKKSGVSNKIVLYVIIPLLAFAGSLFVCAMILTFMQKNSFDLTIDIFKQKSLYVYSACAAGVIFAISIGISIYYDYFASSKILNKTEDAKANIHGNSRWLTEKEISNKFGLYDFNKLPSTQISGYVVQSNIVKNKLLLSIIKESHALLAGVSGDGKSLRYIGMCIQANANSATKPTMIINDAKGELFSQHSKFLKDSGYDVKLINLRYPRESVRYNPLTLVWDLHMKSVELSNAQMNESELQSAYTEYSETILQKNNTLMADLSKKKKSSRNTASENENCIDMMSKDEYYIDWQAKQKKRANDLEDRAQVLIQEITQIIVPEGSGDNKQWSDGAQSICAAIIHGMLEDGCNKELNFTRQMFTITQLSNIVNRQQSQLNNFLRLRPQSSPVFDFAGMIIDNSSEKTVSSYLSTLSTSLKSYLEGGMTYILSDTDINLSTLNSIPTALFILVPDEYPTRHIIASMIIAQVYNELIFQASEFENNKLPRPVYMMLDEFGNLPKLPNLPIWITISKSRGIYFNLLIQSLSQIYAKYGEFNAKTIIQNCHLQLIMGSNEADTVKHFSDKFGTRTIISRTSNFDQKTSVVEFHGSSSLAKVDLLTPDQLQKIPAGLIYWKLLRENPAKTHLEIIFDLNNFIKLGSIDIIETYHPIDSDSVYYNLANRNDYLIEKLRKNNSSGSSPKQKSSNDTLVTEELDDMLDLEDTTMVNSTDNTNQENIHQRLFKI